jgi:hypothetical protein
MTAAHRTVALLVHAAGWFVLVATASASRVGLLGDGVPRGLWLVSGLLVFAVLTAWSGSRLLAAVALVGDRATAAALPTTVASLEGGAMMSQLIAGGFGSTTIRPRNPFDGPGRNHLSLGSDVSGRAA